MTGVRTGLVALSIWLAMPSGMADTGPAAGKPLEEQIAICGGCHGEDGNSTQEAVPSLAGQPPLAVTNQLIYFRERLRQSGIMTPQAQGLEDSAIQALADYYAAQPVASSSTTRDDTLYDQGQGLASQHGCSSCHQPDYSGQRQMPRLAGQREDYLNKAMKDYRDRRRGGPDTTMIEIMTGTPDEDIHALAHFLAHLEAD
ncbi:c-type cytochrome [Litchfieldella xinjiangensis]|uniref:c-type cytochrome n=1 Tax=Litchfieldella xinjiangensis TaxID=1166948 RepID=UPI000695061F|nr:c-type cytochrome [Halomonas xinjiangensis]